MAIVKLKAHELEVGKFYVAYSAKSKKLTRHGNGGVIVEYIGNTKKGANTFRIPLANGTFFQMNIANLDTRKDAFVINADEKTFNQLTMVIGDEGTFEPKYGPKTRERAANGVEITFASFLDKDQRYPVEKQDGTPTYYFRMPDVERLVALNNYQVKITSDTLSLVCAAEELEALRLAEERAKVAKLKEGGVKLAVGKMELGLKCLPDLQKLREEFMKGSDKRVGHNCSFAVLFGDGGTGKVTSQYNHYDAPCHASIYRKPDDVVKGSKRLYILASVIKDYESGVKTKKNLPALRAWVDFMVNDSVYADIFIDKDVNAIIKHGYVVNADAPANVIASALMATRCIYEYAQRGLAFHKLSQHLPANLAYWVSQFASGTISDDGELTSLTFENTNTGHSPTSHYNMTNEQVALLTFGYASPEHMNKSLAGMSMTSYSSPHNVHSIFGTLAKYSEEDTYCDLAVSLRKMPKKAASTRKPVNVFDIPKSSVEASIDGAVALAKEWMVKYGIC